MRSPPGAINNMNIQTKVSSKGSPALNTNIKRSNTVAFSSRRFKGSAIFDISSSPPHSSTISSGTTKPRSTSFHHSQQQSVDLFDFDIEPEHILKSPTTATNFKPLIPTTPLSPTICSSPSTITSPIAANNDTFGSFYSVQQRNDDDPFGDFFTTTQSSKPQSSVKKITENEDDPFGLNSVMQMSASSIKTNTSMSVPTLLTPIMLSPKNVTPATNHDARLASMFEIPTSTVSDQTEEDDWGDWTF
ncbi:hypothetical protein BD770DRAFT_132219 [Pilaira anomala]|nr:hypothetical protein BD770DRAFT_132219 [Pilaira anomala]